MIVELGEKLYNLTTPRRQALHVFAHQHPSPASRSNTTDLQSGRVYWQTLDWLLAEGFVTPVSSLTLEYQLTRLGRRLARKVRLM